MSDSAPPPLTTARVPAQVLPVFEKAQEYVRRYFGGIAFTPEKGRIEVGEERYVLIRASALSVELFDVVRGIHGEGGDELAYAAARELLFDLSHAMGLSDARAFATKLGVEDPIARLSAGPIHFAHAGWAFVDIHEESNPAADESYCLIYDHPYSFEADAWIQAGRKADSPVCVMNSGYSSGWCEESFGLPLVAVELTCRARGDAHCRFVMAPPDAVGARIDAYLAAHPELAIDTSKINVPGFFERDRAAEALLANERRSRYLEQEVSRLMAEALPGGMLQVRKDGSVVRANQAAMTFGGMGPERALRANISEFEGKVFYESGEKVPAELIPIRAALTTGEEQGPITLGFLAEDGEMRWAVFRAAPIRGPQAGEVTGAILTYVDITDRKRAEEEKRRLDAKLREAQRLESLGHLAGGIAHDFNNILVGVLGNASILRAELDPGSPMLERVELIEKAAEEAATLTSQLLAYAGEGRRTVRGVDLSALCAESVRLLRPVLAPNVDVRVDLASDLPPIAGDAQQLRQALVNVLTNAAEAMDPAGGRLEVTSGTRSVSAELLGTCREASAAAPGEHAFVRIRDQGHGMNEQVLSTLFDPFFSTRFAGRGLGLAVVRSIVHAHRGAICVESEVGGGSCFELLLPAAPELRTAPSVEPAPHARSTLEGTVLVVDDEPLVRQLVDRVVRDMGARPLLAEDGDEGVACFEAHGDELAAVVLDVTMPGKDGHEVLRRIRARRSDLPVLMISGFDREAGVADASDDPCIDFLAKPFRAEALRAKLARLTRR